MISLAHVILMELLNNFWTKSFHCEFLFDQKIEMGLTYYFYPLQKEKMGKADQPNLTNVKFQGHENYHFIKKLGSKYPLCGNILDMITNTTELSFALKQLL